MKELHRDKLVAFALVVIGIVGLATLVQALPASDGPETGGVADERVRYDGAQLWRIPYDKQFERNAVADLQNSFDVALWNSNGTTVDMLLKQPSVLGATQLLTGANVSYHIIIDDLQRNIDAENPSAEAIQQLQLRKARAYWPEIQNFRMSRNDMKRIEGAMKGYNSLEPPMELWRDANWGHRMTWSAYHRSADIMGYLEFLAKTYPNLCSIQDIGHTKEGRPLRVLRVSNGDPRNAAIWIDGGIHAREWISPAVVTYIIDQFAVKWEAQPAFVQSVDWYFLPISNPDGYEYSHTTDRLWRKNRGGLGTGRCSGVDLNRNFGYRWGGQGTSQAPCSEVYAGSKAFTELETIALQKFMQSTAANFKGFLTFHSYGQYILYPWGYDRVVPPDYKDLDRVGKEAAKNIRRATGKVYQVGASGSLLYPAAGASDDWAKSLGIKYSYTVEMRDTGYHGFILPADQIPKAAHEAMEMVFAVARAVDAETAK